MDASGREWLLFSVLGAGGVGREGDEKKVKVVLSASLENGGDGSIDDNNAVRGRDGRTGMGWPTMEEEEEEAPLLSSH